MKGGVSVNLARWDGSSGGRSILRPYKVRTGSGSTVTLGDCPCCGRVLRLSAANKTGARCRYEGAQFHARTGALLFYTGRDPETGKRWVQAVMTPEFAHLRGEHQYTPETATDLVDELSRQEDDGCCTCGELLDSYLERNPEVPNGCPECARSFGPNYAGPCEH